MKRVFFILCLFIGLLNATSSQTIIKEKDNNSTDSIRMVNPQKQIERKFTKIEIKYFDMSEDGECLFFDIFKDSVFLKRGWEEKKQEEIIKDFDLINRLSSYIFFFFVEKNKYIILNPRPPGEMIGHYDIIFQVNIFRKGCEPIKKRILVDPDFTYSEEFMEFLELLDSF